MRSWSRAGFQAQRIARFFGDHNLAALGQGQLNGFHDMLFVHHILSMTY